MNINRFARAQTKLPLNLTTQWLMNEFIMTLTFDNNGRSLFLSLCTYQSFSWFQRSLAKTNVMVLVMIRTLKALWLRRDIYLEKLKQTILSSKGLQLQILETRNWVLCFTSTASGLSLDSIRFYYTVSEFCYIGQDVLQDYGTTTRPFVLLFIVPFIVRKQTYLTHLSQLFIFNFTQNSFEIIYFIYFSSMSKTLRNKSHDKYRFESHLEMSKATANATTTTTQRVNKISWTVS